MICNVKEALEDLKKGKMIIVIDDEDRENEGDFLLAAEDASPENINCMAMYGRGLICTPMTKKIADRFELDLMVANNTSSHTTAFTVSIDHEKCDTGISANDRSLTITELCNPKAVASDFQRPGHVFPLIAKDNGVLERRGHTEATVDLCRLAGKTEVGVICEIMNDDGSMARLPQLMDIAKRFDLKILTIEELVRYREENPGFEGSFDLDPIGEKAEVAHALAKNMTTNSGENVCEHH